MLTDEERAKLAVGIRAKELGLKSKIMLQRIKDAEEIIERHNLTPKDIAKIYREFLPEE